MPIPIRFRDSTPRYRVRSRNILKEALLVSILGMLVCCRSEKDQATENKPVGEAYAVLEGDPVYEMDGFIEKLRVGEKVDDLIARIGKPNIRTSKVLKYYAWDPDLMANINIKGQYGVMVYHKNGIVTQWAGAGAMPIFPENNAEQSVPPKSDRAGG